MYRDRRAGKRLKIGTLSADGPGRGADSTRAPSCSACRWMRRTPRRRSEGAAHRARRSTSSPSGSLRTTPKQHKRSWRDDARQMRTMCCRAGRIRAADDITRAEVRALLSEVAKDRGGVTANRLRALLSKLFRWAVPGLYPSEPRRRISRSSHAKRRARACSSDDEIRALWARLEAAEEDETCRPLWRSGSACGC